MTEARDFGQGSRSFRHSILQSFEIEFVIRHSNFEFLPTVFTMTSASPTRPTALITGASVGIGYELAKVFARNNHNLILVSRNQQQLDRVASECRSLGKIDVRVLPKDLAVPSAPQEIFDTLKQSGTVVDVLVNNAGFGTHGEFAQIDLTADLNLLQVNIVALTALTKLYLREMLARGSGKILNVASVASFQPGPLMATYYASKAYVLHFSEAIATEIAGRGVTVTALCPGPTESEFGKRAGIKGDRPFRVRPMPTAPVAQAGYHGLMHGKRIVIPGLSNKIMARMNRFFPRRLIAWGTYQVNRTQ
jgi:short-subunit dehydrogenase